MRDRSKGHSVKEKEIARRHYVGRQIDKYIKWSIRQRGYVKYSDIVELHEKYDIYVY
jgi:hypothetical protein